MSAASKDSLLLLGAGGHARACIDVIEQDGRFEIAGLLGLTSEVGTNVLGYPVIGTDMEMEPLLARYRFGLVAVGQIKSPESRIRLFGQLERNDRCAPAIVSPRAYVSRHARIGAGTVVMHGAVVNAGAAVGRNCIVNSLALVEHDAVIADHCHVATGARINSGVRVGDGTFIGSGSTIRQGLVVGRNCVVGMGTVLRSDCADGVQVPQRRNHA